MNHRNLTTLAIASMGLAVGLGYAIRAAASGTPSTGVLSYAGVLEDSGGPITGSHNIQVLVYDAPAAGNILCQTTTAAIGVVSGHFAVQLPDACTTAVGAHADAWADVLVDGSDTGRTKIGAVPYAVEANHASSADTATNASNITGVAALKTLFTGTQGGLNYGTTQVYWQAGTSSCTGTSGTCAIHFNQPFAHGVLSVVATQGDYQCAPSLVLVPPSQETVTGFNALTPGCMNTSLESIQWFAVGW
jgi:hypothetical protein